MEGATQQELLAGYCDRLVELGVPLMRLHVAQSAFHPKYGGIGLEWHRKAGMTRETYSYSEEPPEQWVRSPFYYMIEQGQPYLHAQLDGRFANRFPIFADLRAEGGRITWRWRRFSRGTIPKRRLTRTTCRRG
ncbi:hypothetical protein ACFOHS_10955 [Jhaorihella thermophila]